MIMPYSPRHQDISVTLTKYEREKSALNSEAASLAYSSIIEELSCRGWFKLYPDSGPLEIRNFFYVLFAYNEVNNGGFAQYFFNGYGRIRRQYYKGIQ